MRAVLLASATVTSIRGFLASICSSHDRFGAPRLTACSTTAALPTISRRLSVRSPIFVISPSFCLPPVERCKGVSPTQAAKSRPLRKVSGEGASARSAVAVMGPIPGLRRLTLRQGKRRRKVDMPVAAPLKAILDATKRTALTILTGPNGKPWRADPKPTHFQHLWRQATLAAGLDGLHFHDLRRTTCTLLAEAGCTPSEIAAMLGWTVATVHQMLDTYQAMTASLSDSAVAKLERKAR
jgi:hypothetical protein